jgi:pyridoxine kinase
MNILSIQSWVAYGHVGNASAAFPLQRLGAEVWTVNTVQFSNHTGYGDWTGDVYTGAQIARLVAGIAARGVLPACDAVLSGYMGDAAIGEAILDAVRQVKQANPAALYCCDPVIGDDGTDIYVRPGIPEFMRDQALPQADIATPNLFELRLLTGLPCDTLDGIKRAITALQAIGPRVVLLTSVREPGTPADATDLIAASDGAFHRLRTPLLPIRVNGAGDAIAAVFLFHYLNGGDLAAALDAAGSAIHGLLARTAAAGSREILTVAAQDEFVSPSELFRSTPC